MSVKLNANDKIHLKKTSSVQSATRTRIFHQLRMLYNLYSMLFPCINLSVFYDRVSIENAGCYIGWKLKYESRLSTTRPTFSALALRQSDSTLRKSKR